MRKDNPDNPDFSRRGALECMAWGGTGLVWVMVGGVPKVTQLLGVTSAAAQTAEKFTFGQISDTHIGFHQAANTNPLQTLDEAITKMIGGPEKPAFLIHTGDISHLSKPQEFDDADMLIGRARLDVHYVPGEHDILDERNGEDYLERYGRKSGAKGRGWYSFDHDGVHFVALVNVFDLKAGGMGNLGPEQLAWLAEDIRDKTSSTPIVVFAHMPLWTVYEAWGWGTDDGAQALALLRRFGSVTVLNGHIHQIAQKVEGNMVFHTGRSTAFPQGEPGKAKSAGPIVVPAGELRSVLGITKVTVTRGAHQLAVTDQLLA